MAPRKSGRRAPQQPQEAAPSAGAVDVIQALAQRLATLGSRQWQVAELEAALDKASAGLSDEGVRAHIAGNLRQCATQLHERLAALQAAALPAPRPQREQEQQRAKRARRTSRAAAEADVTEAEMAEAEAELEALPLIETAAGYGRLATAAADGALDARFSAAALLLSRRLPDTELVMAHVQRLRPVPHPLDAADAGDAAAALERAQALTAAASVALGVCSALACEAGSSEDALRMFTPAVSLLHEAVAQLQAAEAEAEAEEEATAASAPLLAELAALAGRALAGMHAALQLAQHGGGSGGSGHWRSNPAAPSPAEAADAARLVAACLCTLLASLRLQQLSRGSQPGGGQRQQIESLAEQAAADLRLLAPLGPSGLLQELASEGDEASASPAAARRHLVLYRAAAKHELPTEFEYLARLVAARSAAAAAQSLGEEALAAGIAGDACALPNSQALVAWLQEQPPSGIVSAALDAARRGLDTLSAHLVRECSMRSLRALWAAMQAGGAAGGERHTGAGGAGEEGAPATDDLLFFADTQGDATMFGREWQSESEGGDSEDEEGGRGGVDLGSLPDEGDE